MSQRTRLLGAKVSGAVYLGDRAQADGAVVSTFSSSSAEVLAWLCDGFRFRFNQHRSKRSGYLFCEDREGNRVRVEQPDGAPVLVPLGRSVTDISDKQARLLHSHLSAVPSRVLQAAGRIEETDWFSAVKRRRTNAKRGRPPGVMPGFRSRRRDDQTFVCWYNGGANATYHQTGRRSGVVTINGQNPKAKIAPAGTCRWSIQLRVRVSQPVRPYTSVRVNLTKSEIVFVNRPLPIKREATGEAVGLDRGIVHTIARSDGVFHDASNTKAIQRKIAFHQRRMAKSRLVAEREGRDWRSSRRYRAHRAEVGRLSAHRARIRKDSAHKASTSLVRSFDLIGIEDLRLSSMTRRVKGRGAARKRGLNRALSDAALARLSSFLEYKCALAGVPLVKVDPAYTSQRCHACSYTAGENRESQAVFSCRRCGWAGNADTNAALNILGAAIDQWARTSTVTAVAGSDPTGGPAGSKGKTGSGHGRVGACDEPRTTWAA